MPVVPRHNVFISYHHEQDQEYENRFGQMMGSHIVDKSVNIGDIDDGNAPTEATLQIIRERFIANSSVTVVLIGRCTWRRKYVDWEIGASLRDTRTNPRCGLLGILLPSHPDFGQSKFALRLIPPRLADNCGGDNPFARIYHWPGPEGANEVKKWIDRALVRSRKQPDPDISRHPFGRNWRGRCSDGWKVGVK